MNTLDRDIRIIKYTVIVTALMVAIAFMIVVWAAFSDKSGQASSTSSLEPNGFESREQRAKLASDFLADVNDKRWHDLYISLHPLLKTKFGEEDIAQKGMAYVSMFDTLLDPDEIDCLCKETENGVSCDIRYSITGSNGARGILTLTTLQTSDETARVAGLDITRQY